MKALLAALLLSISANSIADNSTFRFPLPFNNLFINANSDGFYENQPDPSGSDNDNIDEGSVFGCDNPDNVGSIGSNGKCSGKLIVSNELLKSIVDTRGDYSDEAIYTGQVTNMSSLFYNEFIIYSISGWDISNVTDMSYMFRFSRFTPSSLSSGGIEQWNVSSVINMKGMFSDASRFSQDISNWDVSNVTNMDSMFFNATEFGRQTDGIANWCVINISHEPELFSYRANLHQDKRPRWGTCP
tara:strand:+ start:1002 stop:1730 length:729 start_codon:yes stop_codon:yes gene_type:complete